MRRQIYYTDLTYIDRQDGHAFGDMGYGFGDILDTYNTDTLEENIENLRYNAKETRPYDDNDSITLLELVSAVAEYDDEEDGLWSGKVLDDTTKVVYRIAVCTEEEWKRYEPYGKVDEFVN